MTKTAKTYGGALYDLAKEENLCEQLLGELEAVCTIFADNPAYRKLLIEPSVPKEERRSLLDEAWRGHLHPYTLNFMKLLCDNGTIAQFPDCAAAYRKRWYDEQGIIEVRAVCASPLREGLQEKLRRKVEKMTGKRVELSVSVDESLLGGIRLELPDRQYDGSVRGQLQELRSLLQNAEV